MKLISTAGHDLAWQCSRSCVSLQEEPPKPVQASSEPVKAVQKEKDINSVASKSTQTPAPEPAKPSAEPVSIF